jgi:hypothetical protein
VKDAETWGDYGREKGAVLIAGGDDLVKQVCRLGTFGALDFVEPEFVDDEPVWVGIVAQSRRKGLIGE